MILIFDMDDTLYDESTYVQSSFWAVSNYLSKKYGISKKIIFHEIMKIFKKQGRGNVFDYLLNYYKIFSMAEVKKCVSVYRKNIPDIKLYKEAKEILEDLSVYPKYVVTDGNKMVQSIKVSSLGIEAHFKKIILTHRHGVQYAKPDTYCFKLIKKREKCKWNHLVYVADDPNKDFVNLNPLGVKTVRVLTGRFKKQKAKRSHDANFHINNLSELLPLLNIKK